MSQENMEVVRAWFDLDLEDVAATVRDDARWDAWARRAERLVDVRVEGRFRTGVDGDGEIFTGLDGLRTAGLDWLASMATYRRQIEQMVDLDDRVLVLAREFASLHGGDAEMILEPAHLFRLRDARITWWETFPDRAEALKLVGLEG